MKQKIFLSESELHKLVESSVYNLLKEDTNESVMGGLKNVYRNRKNSFNALKIKGFKGFKDNIIDDYQDGYHTEGFQKCIKQYLKMMNAYKSGNKIKYQFAKEDFDSMINRYGFDVNGVKTAAKDYLK